MRWSRANTAWIIEQRVAGRFGHLITCNSAELLAKLDTSHCSQYCAQPASAKRRISPSLVEPFICLNAAELHTQLDWPICWQDAVWLARTLKKLSRKTMHKYSNFMPVSKSVCATEDQDYVNFTFFRDDTSAFVVKRKNSYTERRDKNRVNALHGAAESTQDSPHIIEKLLSANGSPGQDTRRIPVECVVRNVGSGSRFAVLVWKMVVELNPSKMSSFPWKMMRCHTEWSWIPYRYLGWATDN